VPVDSSSTSTTVLIASRARPEKLARCLASLARQTLAPGQVLVIWQGDDTATRDAALTKGRELGLPIEAVHSSDVGVVAAENAGLERASGEVVALIDDDAIAPPDWLERHASHYADPTVGAVGGPARNFTGEGTPYPERAIEPVGKLTSFGRSHGNMHDHPAAWRGRPPRDVDHLVGNNLSFRRSGLDRFETGLRPYWQMFELDACLGVRARGLRVIFDFANVVEHHPTNTAYAGGRGEAAKEHAASACFNQALVLSKRSPTALRPVRLAYLLLVGSTAMPGLAALPLAVARFGGLARELRWLGTAWRASLAGWRAGARARPR
jgi:hypothetical protein